MLRRLYALRQFGQCFVAKHVGELRLQRVIIEVNPMIICIYLEQVAMWSDPRDRPAEDGGIIQRIQRALKH